MRVDRFLEARFPGLSFSHIQRIIRKGELRVNGKRAQPKDRLAAGQAVRIPPLQARQPKPARAGQRGRQDARLPQIDHALRGRRRAGAQQADGPCRAGRLRHGAAPRRHARGPARRHGQRPRLVHRLDKDTAGCLARRQDALCRRGAGQDVSLARGAQDLLGAGRRRAEAASRAASPPFSPRRRGRTTASCASPATARRGRATPSPTTRSSRPPRASSPGCRSSRSPAARTSCARTAPISAIRSSAIRNISTSENWELPGGLQNRLHLLARRIVVPHPRGGVIDVTAPLPPHMQQSWNLLGFDAGRYDPIDAAPEK